MLILKDLSGEVPDTNAHYLNLEVFSKDSPFALFYGYNTQSNIELLRENSSKIKVLFNNWAPCEFAQELAFPGVTPMQATANFDIVASICPYTAHWLNSLKTKTKFIFIYYPIDLNLEVPSVEKQFDVIYHGGVHGIEHSMCLSAISKFNYRFCSMTHHINSYTKDHLHYATDTNLGFRKKIELVASSKISICYNLVHVMSDQIERIIKYRALGRNEAFSTVGFWNVMPQFKTRMHEAALSKSINLVRRDQWNVVERFYKPNVDFIYFETESELPRVIDAILSKWDSDHIQGIVESAYQRVKRYSTANFVRDLEAFCKSSVS